MRLPIKLVINKNGARSDGNCLIYLQFCHTSTRRILIGTGVAIPQQYWDKRTARISEDMPIQYGIVDELKTLLNKKLEKAEAMITHVITNSKGCPVKFLKDNFLLSDDWKIKKILEYKNNPDIYKNIDQYIEERKSEVKQCTINVIRVMKANLIKFEQYRGKAITF